MLDMLDLCSGIGGFTLAGDWTGKIRTVGFAETDPYCQKVLAYHWPGRYQFGDVKNVTNESMGRIGISNIGIISAGFPCQPFSTSGKQQGTSDPRYLWPEIERIIRTVRPPYIVLENVPGLLSNDKGRVFGRILGQLAACGYDAEWEVLPASAFGAWHRRDRVWIVAYPNCQRQPQPPTLSESSADHQRYTTTSERIRRTKFYAVGASLETTPHTASLRRESIPAESRSSSAGQTEGWLLQPTGDSTLAPHASEQRLQTEDCLRQRGSGLAWRAPRIFRFTPAREGFWTHEPEVGRLVYGVSGRTPEYKEWENGMKALGNSIVPQIAHWIFERILEDYEGNTR